jgi:hypothetical protein
MDLHTKLYLGLYAMLILWIATVYYYERQLSKADDEKVDNEYHLNRLSINERRQLRKIDQAKASVQRDEWGEIIDGHITPRENEHYARLQAERRADFEKHLHPYKEWGIIRGQKDA